MYMSCFLLPCWLAFQRTLTTLGYCVVLFSLVLYDVCLIYFVWTFRSLLCSSLFCMLRGTAHPQLYHQPFRCIVRITKASWLCAAIANSSGLLPVVVA
jgi:hypothetical protein